MMTVSGYRSRKIGRPQRGGSGIAVPGPPSLSLPSRRPTGRPRLDLTDEQRAERRRKQHEVYRRRQGIPPKQVQTREASKECD